MTINLLTKNLRHTTYRLNGISFQELLTQFAYFDSNKEELLIKSTQEKIEDLKSELSHIKSIYQNLNEDYKIVFNQLITKTAPLMASFRQEFKLSC